jgi:hypothetical protein
MIVLNANIFNKKNYRQYFESLLKLYDYKNVSIGISTMTYD